MTNSIRLLICLVCGFGIAAAYAEESPSATLGTKDSADSDASRIVSEYLAQWDWGTQRALAAESAISSFTDELHSSQLLLKVLQKPGYERLRMAYVLHETRQGIRTVEATINETPKESEYLLPSYRRRLDQLRSDAAILEKALNTIALERPNTSLERTRDR